MGSHARATAIAWLFMVALAPGASALTPMPLVDTVWAWHATTGADGGPTSSVASPERYTLRLAADGSVRVRADCNRGSGRYEANDVELSFGPIATTKMGCPAGSRGSEFLDALARVQTYRFEGIDLVLLAPGTALRFRP
jgi:heat shock protein HslJ